jgi:serine/threonine-protein kinase RsbW
MTKPVNTIDITIPSSSEFVGVVRLAISGIAARMDFTIEEIEDIKIAVSEACTNAVQYAYDKNKSAKEKIFITCNLYEDKLEIIVKDLGKGFDLNQAVSTKKTKPAANTIGLGLGITFIRSLMDEAYFDSTPNKGTTVRMIKKAPKF